MNRLRIYELMLVFLLVVTFFTSFFLVLMDHKIGGCEKEFIDTVSVIKDTLSYGN